MAKKGMPATVTTAPAPSSPARGRPLALLDTRGGYYGDNLEQLATPPFGCAAVVGLKRPVTRHGHALGLVAE